MEPEYPVAHVQAQLPIIIAQPNLESLFNELGTALQADTQQDINTIFTRVIVEVYKRQESLENAYVAERERLLQKIVKLRARIAELEKNEKSRSDLIGTLEWKLLIHQAHLDRAKDYMDELDKQRVKLQEQVTGFQGRITTLQRDYDQSQKNYEKLDKEKGDLEERIKGLTTTINNQGETITGLDQKLKIELKTKDKEIETKDARIRQLEYTLALETKSKNQFYDWYREYANEISPEFLQNIKALNRAKEQVALSRPVREVSLSFEIALMQLKKIFS